MSNADPIYDKVLDAIRSDGRAVAGAVASLLSNAPQPAQNQAIELADVVAEAWVTQVHMQAAQGQNLHRITQALERIAAALEHKISLEDLD